MTDQHHRRPARRTTRRRCAQPECRHAPRAHTEAGCGLCSCTGWVERRPHVWRQDVTDAWFFATQRWLTHREEAAVGYATEEAEFEAHHPRPRLADFMDALSPGVPPDRLEQLFTYDVCASCHGTGHARPTTQTGAGTR